jgi:hypothetical protein
MSYTKETKKVFISGAITGCDGYKEKFLQAEEDLKSFGYAVMNPAVLDEGFEHGEYMKVTLAMLSVCDTIYILPCAVHSKGAIEEILEAVKAGKTVILHEDLEESILARLIKEASDCLSLLEASLRRNL